MHEHPTLDLRVHSDEELAALLGEPLAERRHLHSWPFSMVEMLTMANGARWIYKAQRTPTFEPEFYERVRSPLLPDHRILSRDGVYATLLLEFLDAPLLRDLTLSEGELAAHGRRAVAAIGEVREEVPVYIDIGSVARWRDFVHSTLDLSSRLVKDGRLVLSVARPGFEDVARWAESAAVSRLIERTSRLTHGDLNAGNVFVRDNGYWIIDWQRPQIAPAEVDLAALLERKPSLFQHVAPPAVGVFYFLRLFWAVHAKANLLPELRNVFDWWSSEALGFIRQAGELSE